MPGIMNEEADHASRKQYAFETEWKLNEPVFRKIEQRWGPFEFDLFATLM